MRRITRYHETEPMAFGIFAGLLIILAAFVAIFDAGCQLPAQPSYPRPQQVQLDYAVRVETFCLTADPLSPTSDPHMRAGAGSGVILGARHALTAAHVVECGYLGDIHVITASGRRLHARVDRVWADRDTARLELLDGEDSFPGALVPPRVAMLPLKGGAVCAASAFPERDGTCGVVDELDAASCRNGWCSDTSLELTVRPGNSGSGLYNPAGELVGLVTGGGFNANPDGTMAPTGRGFAVSLWAIRKELMP